MPKCYMDGIEQAVLKSRVIPGEIMGYALCDGCMKKTDQQLAKEIQEKKVAAGEQAARRA